MTIDEAIKNREECLKYLEGIGKSASPECVEAVRWSVKALKAMKSENSGEYHTIEDHFRDITKMVPLTLDQLHKDEWKAEWIPMTDDDGCTWFECSTCEYDLDSLDDPPQFCPGCGRAMTQIAFDEIEKRLIG